MSGRLAVTGLGMVSSVGRDVVTACASLRAGRRRPSDLPHMMLVDDENEPLPLWGYPMRGYTDGFVYRGLWARIARGCLEDLLAYGRLPRTGELWARTGVALVVPHLDPDRFPPPEDCGLDRLVEGYGVPLFQSLRLPVPAGQFWVVDRGHAGVALATWQAAQVIGEGRVDRVLVLAVDSYLDLLTLEWLEEHRRLKTPDHPAGLIPGEAGACILLESEGAARQRGAEIQAFVVGTAAGEEPNHLFSEDVNTGAALATVAAQATADSFSGDVYSDLNGEPWRAYELGCARTRLSGRIADEARFVLPADSLGETGAASGAVSLCMAVRSFARGYALGAEALVLSSSEHGQVGAVRVARA